MEYDVDISESNDRYVSLELSSRDGGPYHEFVETDAGLISRPGWAGASGAAVCIGEVRQAKIIGVIKSAKPWASVSQSKLDAVPVFPFVEDITKKRDEWEHGYNRIDIHTRFRRLVAVTQSSRTVLVLSNEVINQTTIVASAFMHADNVIHYSIVANAPTKKRFDTELDRLCGLYSADVSFLSDRVFVVTSSGMPDSRLRIELDSPGRSIVFVGPAIGYDSIVNLVQEINRRYTPTAWRLPVWSLFSDSPEFPDSPESPACSMSAQRICAPDTSYFHSPESSSVSSTSALTALLFDYWRTQFNDCWINKPFQYHHGACLHHFAKRADSRMARQRHKSIGHLISKLTVRLFGSAETAPRLHPCFMTDIHDLDESWMALPANQIHRAIVFFILGHTGANPGKSTSTDSVQVALVSDNDSLTTAVDISIGLHTNGSLHPVIRVHIDSPPDPMDESVRRANKSEIRAMDFIKLLRAAVNDWDPEQQDVLPLENLRWLMRQEGERESAPHLGWKNPPQEISKRFALSSEESS